jgi:2-keto-3-deoxy-galactonokinase
VLTRWLAQRRRPSRVDDGDGWHLGEDERHRFLDEEAASRGSYARGRDAAAAGQIGSTRGWLGFLEAPAATDGRQREAGRSRRRKETAGSMKVRNVACLRNVISLQLSLAGKSAL